MKPLQTLLTRFNGLHYAQEYLCFAKESFTSQLRVYLIQDKQVGREVTDQHFFVGYCPLILAFPFGDLPGNIELVFSHHSLQPNDSFASKDALATLTLELVRKQQHQGSDILYYEGRKGSHRFFPLFRQYICSLNNRWFNKKPGNVFLHGNLYKQVQVAYAIPREISLITVGNPQFVNLFPTDLHGQVNDTQYIISLRTGGKAYSQVLAEGRLLISQIQSEAYKLAYSLGKNHMQDMKTKAHFAFGQLSSAAFGLPVPQAAISCKELLLTDSFIRGIHTVMLFTIAGSRQLQPPGNTLAHIHHTYATWRYKNRLQGNYLLR